MDDYTRAWPTTLDDAQRETETWRADYNDVRPHSSLDDAPPAVFAAAHRETAA
jgi:putative transposase